MYQTSPESTSGPSTNDASEGKPLELPADLIALHRLIYSFNPDLAAQISSFEQLRHSQTWDNLAVDSLKKLQLSTTTNATAPAEHVVRLAIPRYSSEPKDFDDSVVDGIFVWQHRLDLVKSLIAAVVMGKKVVTNEFGAPPADFKPEPSARRGMILSGPHGIGKSGMTRFIAAVAQMNDCFLFYVPYARELFQSTGKTLQFNFKFAITTLLRFNYAKLCNYPYPVKEEGAKASYLEKLLKVTRYGPSTSQAGETIEEVWNQCITFMVNMVEYPVVIIVDEHNELFKPTLAEQVVPADIVPELAAFCSPTTFVAEGKRTFLVIAGSAHSKFEYKNDPTMKRWKQYLQPTPKDAFIAISRLQASTNKVFPKSMTNEAQIEERYNNFGGILRELKYYVAEYENTAEHIAEWMRARSTEICGELDAYYMKLPPAKQEQYITYLRDHLWQQSKIIEGSIYDQGFWYMQRSAHKSTQWIAVPTCDPVRFALQTFSFLQRDVTDPLSLSISQVERGLKFEECFRDALSFFGTTKLAVVDYGRRAASELCLGSTRMAYQVTSFDTPRPTVSGTCTFWLNGIENFPGFDFAWIDVVTRDICLISISISSIYQHEKDTPSPLMKAMSNSFDVRDNSVTAGDIGIFTSNSSSAHLLHWLTGATWKTQYATSAQKGDKKAGTPPKEAVSDRLVAVMDPLPSVDQQWTVRFLFFSGQEETSKSSNKLTNLLLAGPKTSAAFLRSPLQSVETYLNRLKECNAQKAKKLRPAEETQEVHKPPLKKKATLTATTETTATMDEDTDES